MKRLIPIFLCLVLLCGCASRYAYEVTVDGVALCVDTANHTITHGEDVYRYGFENPIALELTTNIYYPNGTVYSRTDTFGNVIGVSGNQPSGGTSATQDTGTYNGEFDESRYLPGKLLARAAREVSQQEAEWEEARAKAGVLIFGGVMMILLGLVFFFFPEHIWHIKHWWCVDGGEPSQFYLDMGRFSGVASMVIGGILLLVGIF